MNSSGSCHYTTRQHKDLLLSLIVQTQKEGARPAYAGKNKNNRNKNTTTWKRGVLET